MSAALEEVKSLIEHQGQCWEKFKRTQDMRFDNVEQELRQFKAWQLEQTSPGGSHFELGAISAPVTDEERASFKVKLANGELIPTIGKAARVQDFFPKDTDGFSIAEFVRGNMLGTKAVSNSALVPVGVSSNVIDAVRAQLTVVQAGAKTIVIDGPTNLAKIISDPVISVHTESVDDIQESDITLATVALKPKALATVVPLTMELVADSPNLDAVLNASLASAFAAKLDEIALATILADTAIPTNTTGLDPNAWANILTGVGLALAAKQTIPTSMISNTADFIARSGQLASTSGSWLGSPPSLAGIKEYPTTNVAAGTAIYGGFELGFAIAMRQELRLEVIRFLRPTSASHMLMAYMRAEGVILQPKRLFIQRKTVA